MPQTYQERLLALWEAIVHLLPEWTGWKEVAWNDVHFSVYHAANNTWAIEHDGIEITHHHDNTFNLDVADFFNNNTLNDRLEAWLPNLESAVGEWMKHEAYKDLNVDQAVEDAKESND